jgi:hypothetical protein
VQRSVRPRLDVRERQLRATVIGPCHALALAGIRERHPSSTAIRGTRPGP